MAEKIYTPEEIDNINLGRNAVIGKTYTDTRGYSFVGIEDNRLHLKETGANVVFTPSDANSATNVQDAIKNINKPVRVTITFDYNEALSFEDLYVPVSDTTIKASSIITAYVTMPTTRDADELEFTNFVCSVASITAGVGYEILVIDHNLQAEGDYILNIIKT